MNIQITKIKREQLANFMNHLAPGIMSDALFNQSENIREVIEAMACKPGRLTTEYAALGECLKACDSLKALKLNRWSPDSQEIHARAVYAFRELIGYIMPREQAEIRKFKRFIKKNYTLADLERHELDSLATELEDKLAGGGEIMESFKAFINKVA